MHHQNFRLQNRFPDSPDPDMVVWPFFPDQILVILVCSTMNVLVHQMMIIIRLRMHVSGHSHDKDQIQR